jgi:hypothetical protein
VLNVTVESSGGAVMWFSAQQKRGRAEEIAMHGRITRRDALKLVLAKIRDVC